MTTITLCPTAPYHFAGLLDILRRYAHPTLDIVHDGVYWRAVNTGAGLALWCVRNSGTVDSPALEAQLVAQSGAVDVARALERLRYILHLDADTMPFFAMAQDDASLWSVIAPVYGIPYIRSETMFDALAEAIIEQQIAWTAAQRAQRWLVEWAGNFIEYDGQCYYTFPTAQQIANATLDDLKPLKITFKRMALLIHIAQQVVGGEFALEDLRRGTIADAYEALLRLKGIGPWTAAVTVARGLGARDYVTHNDVALQAAVNRYFYGEEGRISEDKMRETFAPYGEHAGLVGYYTLLRWVIDKY